MRSDLLIDISWIPKAKASYLAIQQQIVFMEQSIERIKTQRYSRYAEDSVQYSLVGVELAYAESMLKMLRSLLEGKTVSQ